MEGESEEDAQRRALDLDVFSRPRNLLPSQRARAEQHARSARRIAPSRDGRKRPLLKHGGRRGGGGEEAWTGQVEAPKGPATLKALGQGVVQGLATISELRAASSGRDASGPLSAPRSTPHGSSRQRPAPAAAPGMGPEAGGRSNFNLSSMLDESVPDAIPDSSPSISAWDLKVMLRRNLGRVVDVFRRFDADGSGSVDLGEFTKGILHLFKSAKTDDVHDLFLEFDVDGSGTIEYQEMQTTIRNAEKLQSEREALRRFVPPEPSLPSSLTGRKRELLALRKQFLKERGMPNTPPTFFDACRMLWPKDDKQTTHMMLKYIEQLDSQRKVANQQKQRETDEKLLVALDANGDGKIQLSEFCELSKATGFDRLKMREKFRQRDVPNSGELSMDQMREVLAELRDEMIRSQAELTPEQRAAQKAAQKASPLGKLVAQAGLG